MIPLTLHQNKIASPTTYTPSKLSQFFQHAEERLGVFNATMYENQLQWEDYGPDILHLFDNNKLTALGTSLGGASWLKAGNSSWRHGPDAKFCYG
ncbi:hypothetical protein L208DRAFT_1279790 [Tricholoma matsutake]|nr:hypothetical protein L208DRAFT_1279790 [Tricholoma matsutake 945]